MHVSPMLSPGQFFHSKFAFRPGWTIARNIETDHLFINDIIKKLQRGFIEGWHHYCNVMENLHKLAFKLHHQTAMVCKKTAINITRITSIAWKEITINMGDYKQDHSSTYSHYWSPCKLLASDPAAAPEILTNRKLTLSWPYIYFLQDTWIISRRCNQSH